jgi:hypothetical protein
MIIELIAKRDKKSTGTKYNRYTFGNTRSAINGGIYVEKGQELPEQIVLMFQKKEIEDAT